VIEDELDAQCGRLPKFHAQCNPIEYVWGSAKKKHRHYLIVD